MMYSVNPPKGCELGHEMVSEVEKFSAIDYAYISYELSAILYT
jgi:hypothetical protein